MAMMHMQRLYFAIEYPVLRFGNQHSFKQIRHYLPHIVPYTIECAEAVIT